MPGVRDASTSGAHHTFILVLAMVVPDHSVDNKRKTVGTQDADASHIPHLSLSGCW